MMNSTTSLKQHILATLDSLPEESLSEVATFLEFLQYKHAGQRQTPYVPVALGGLWQDISISDEDIAEVRREMWSSFGEREL
jgi:hypothetical protein